MSLPRSLSLLALASAVVLAGCATATAPAPGSKLAGIDQRFYTGVRRPAETRNEMEVVQRVISTKSQRAIATKRAKFFWDTLPASDQAYLRSLGVTHVCVEVPAIGSHKGEKSVMMWDTQQQNFVGNEVFEVNGVPPDLSVLRMPDYVAVCVLKYSA